MRSSSPTARRRSVVVLVAAAVLVSTISAASATPVDDKRAQAQRLQQQIDANGDRIAALAERYHGATLAYEQATAAITDAQRRLDAASAHVRRLRDGIAIRAIRLYTGAGSTTPLSAIDAESVSDLNARSEYTEAATEADGGSIARLRDAQDDLRAVRADLQRQQGFAKDRQAAASSAKRAAEQADAEQRRLLGQVKGELVTLVRQEQQRQAEAARRAAIARLSNARANGGRRAATGAVDPSRVGGDFGDVPAPSARVAAVIAYARAQLGKPYVFNTSGPDTFDCSGLTMMAWRQAGVAMAHYSGSQYAAFPKVPLGALQPGDLVFKGPGGRDHVALYIGGGMQIAATHTGDYVRLQPLSRNLIGAVRPG
jgi:cell wall-associated NlpC family hydrolase